MNYSKIQSLLALLLLGSASLLAATTPPASAEGTGDVSGDPFGDVNWRKYASNMSLTAIVRIAGQPLGKGTVVAAYCGDELRGKDCPMDDGAYTDILYLDIYGDTKGDKLHFKVYIPGEAATPSASAEGTGEAFRVVEVDQGLTYASDAIVGSPNEPYYIDLPAPVTTTFSAEGWATTCLPFDAEVPAGVTVWNATAIEDGQLVTEALQLPTVHSPLWNGSEISILPKNTPVLLSIATTPPASAEATGVASCEWLPRVSIATTTPASAEATESILAGTTEATPVVACSVLTLGHSKETGEIGFWLFTGTMIPANRAYISKFPAGARGVTFRFDDTTTSLHPSSFTLHPSPSFYDLQGRSVNSQRSMFNGRLLKKGVNGQVIIIR